MIRHALIRFCLWRARGAEARASAALFVRVAIPARDLPTHRWRVLSELVDVVEDEHRRAREWRALAEKVRAL